jgi:AcrR family transcriptional regulator
VQPAAHANAGDEDSLGDASGDDRVHRILVRELGSDLAELFRQSRRAQEQSQRRRRPTEGLRERKRRLTRQRISDVATMLFATRGFDHVKVSEVAEIVGVSEKTIYNYFPTKESMVLDLADEGIERLARALRERAPGETVTRAALRALNEDMEQFDWAPDELLQFFPMFWQMLSAAPSLRDAWGDMQNRIAEVAAEELAAGAEIDPRDPEPLIAGRALAGLGQVAFDCRVRHINAGLRGNALRDAVTADIERAARMLDTGLWSFDLMAKGHRKRQQVEDAIKAAEDARVQVVKALRQARAAWRVVRRQGGPPAA